MFCPSCGKEIPDNSRYCLVCGKSPMEALSKPVDHQGPQPKSNTRRNILLGILVLLVVFVLVRSSMEQNNGTFPGIPQNDPLTPSVFIVKAGQMYYVRFIVQSSARVEGRFEASGGGGNDIQALITDVDNFENWKNGHQARVLYQSDKTTIGNINVSINRPGTYYIAFNNQFSLFSDKTVTASIVLHH
jgi:hypothetical protein